MSRGRDLRGKAREQLLRVAIPGSGVITRSGTRQSDLPQETRKPRVYMAGPIAFAEGLGVPWREELPEEYGDLEWVNPLAKYHEPIEEVKWPAKKVINEDLKLIESSDAVYVHWENTVSVGTPMEVYETYRYQKKPVVVECEDPDDLPLWLEGHSHFRSNNREDCVAFLRGWLL